jgi:hypothetical protein
MNELNRTDLSFTGKYGCTAASLMSFGKFYRPNSRDALMERTSHEVREILNEQAFTYRKVPGYYADLEYEFLLHENWTHVTLNWFIKNHPNGAYFLATKDHAMALINGELTDTAFDRTGRRWLQEVWEITNQP